jgi:hypothetical protein
MTLPTSELHIHHIVDPSQHELAKVLGQHLEEYETSCSCWDDQQLDGTS